MKRYDSYIWDLGGTLLDNYTTSTNAFIDVLFRHGRVGLFDEVHEALKISTDEAVKRFASDLTDFLAEYKAREAELLEHPVLFENASGVLETLRQAGAQHFMISHRDNQVCQLLDAAGILEEFTDIVTSDAGFLRKPAPDSILYLLDKHQLSSDSTVMIGDRQLDIDAGHNAGCHTIFFAPDSPDANPSADATIHHLKDIL